MDDSSDLEFSDDDSWNSDECVNLDSTVNSVTASPVDSSSLDVRQEDAQSKNLEQSVFNVKAEELSDDEGKNELNEGVNESAPDLVSAALDEVPLEIESENENVSISQNSEEESNERISGHEFLNYGYDEPEVADREYNRITANFDSSSYEPDLELIRSTSDDLRDVKYGAALVVTMFIALLIWGTSYVREPHSHLLPSTWSSSGTKVFMVFVVLCSSAMSLAVVYLVAEKRVLLTPTLLQSAAGACTLSFAVLALYLMMKGWFFIGLVTLGFVAVDASRMFHMNEEAQFASVLLMIVHETYGSEKGIQRLWLIIVSFNCIFLILWSIHFVDLIQCHDVAHIHFTGLIQIVLTFGILFWISGIIRAILSIVTVGVCTNSILDANSSSQEVGELLLKRSMAVSFGSLCAGSFRLNVAETISTLGWALDTASNLVKLSSGPNTFHERVKGRIEKAFEYGTYYAWARVGLRGLSFASSSRATWHKISAQGMDFVLHGTYVEHILRYLAWMNGVVLALFFAMLLVYKDHPLISILAIMSVCNLGARAVFEPWLAAVSSIFICYAEYPDSISSSHPILYHRLVRISEIQAFDDNKRNSENEV